MPRVDAQKHFPPDPNQFQSTIQPAKLRVGNVSATWVSHAPRLVLTFFHLTFLTPSLFLLLLLLLPFPGLISLSQLLRFSLSCVLYTAFLCLGGKQKALYPVSGLILAWQTAFQQNGLPSSPKSQLNFLHRGRWIHHGSWCAHLGIDMGITGKTLPQHCCVIKQSSASEALGSDLGVMVIDCFASI